MAKHHIGSIDDFPEGNGVGIKVNETEIAIFNLDGELYAILDNCLHKNYTLHGAGSKRLNRDDEIRGGIDTNNCSIRCPWHGLEWSLEDGYSETINKRIPTYDVEVNDDGDVYLLR